MIRREWDRIRKRAMWSWAGWMDAWRNEHSLMQWIVANLISAGVALILPLTFAERAIILSLGVMVLAMELMNTAIERTIDYISTEEHDLAGRAKDLASAAVAVSAIAVGVAWVVVFWRLIAG